MTDVKRGAVWSYSKYQKMTEDEKEEQLVSFVFGNLNVDRSGDDIISKEEILAAIKGLKEKA
jgi:hypothetical protein